MEKTVFCVGDLVLIKKEFVDEGNDPMKLFEVTTSMDDMERALIRGLDAVNDVAEVLVSWEMLELKARKEEWKH
ncbi:MAG: hypothetical protein Q4C42_07980 [Clostridia bacterium]|nr:hypothetical protein [Clostridia bacterium]